jgi:hypothetical protein
VCPGLRTSGRSSPWQRARRSSNGGRETGSGRRRFNGSGALRARSVGEVRGGACRCANEGGGRGRARLRAQVTEGEAVASFTRDVGAESAARADRGGGYAKTEKLTAGARGQRERGKRALTRGERAR